MCKKSATKIFTINRNILFKLIGRFYIVQSYTFLNIQNDIINEEILYIKDIYIKPKSNIFDLSNYKGSRDYKNKNLISTSYINKFTLETILGNNLKIIYVKYDEKVLSKFEIFFKKIEINVEDEFKDIEFFLIERIKLQDVLNKENLYDFLQERRNIDRKSVV